MPLFLSTTRLAREAASFIFPKKVSIWSLSIGVLGKNLLALVIYTGFMNLLATLVNSV